MWIEEKPSQIPPHLFPFAFHVSAMWNTEHETLTFLQLNTSPFAFCISTVRNEEHENPIFTLLNPSLSSFHIFAMQNEEHGNPAFRMPLTDVFLLFTFPLCRIRNPETPSFTWI